MENIDQNPEIHVLNGSNPVDVFRNTYTLHYLQDAFHKITGR
jgi:hypothetical protein